MEAPIKCKYRTRKHIDGKNVDVYIDGYWNEDEGFFIHFDEKGLATVVFKKEWITFE